MYVRVLSCTVEGITETTSAQPMDEMIEGLLPGFAHGVGANSAVPQLQLKSKVSDGFVRHREKVADETGGCGWIQCHS
jgi:hypothetical protein